jgi:hypothetical protein
VLKHKVFSLIGHAANYGAVSALPQARAAGRPLVRAPGFWLWRA